MKVDIVADVILVGKFRALVFEPLRAHFRIAGLCFFVHRGFRLRCGRVEKLEAREVLREAWSVERAVLERGELRLRPADAEFVVGK